MGTSLSPRVYVKASRKAAANLDWVGRELECTGNAEVKATEIPQPEGPTADKPRDLEWEIMTQAALGGLTCHNILLELILRVQPGYASPLPTVPPPLVTSLGL